MTICEITNLAIGLTTKSNMVSTIFNVRKKASIRACLHIAENTNQRIPTIMGRYHLQFVFKGCIHPPGGEHAQNQQYKRANKGEKFLIVLHNISLCTIVSFMQFLCKARLRRQGKKCICDNVPFNTIVLKKRRSDKGDDQ
ncbi:MAG: hypothetical protein COW58_07400 [Thalassolituus sp. CG17_big_fil_post_rev_8_21_14_2_50_53_8]|nr:MAG: hypothetical protein COW58_07400 [Thalassolituus sp. CG17_big_fil_post_rev_8_21_14_2_50_53_8]